VRSRYRDAVSARSGHELMKSYSGTRRRVTDRSRIVARDAVQPMLARFEPWHGEIARFNARAMRRLTEEERLIILSRCGAIQSELLAVRTELILELADAPAEVSGNNRVTDVERALDSVEAALNQARAKVSEPLVGAAVGTAVWHSIQR
jgi:hypothetical protein